MSGGKKSRKTEIILSPWLPNLQTTINLHVSILNTYNCTRKSLQLSSWKFIDISIQNMAQIKFFTIFLPAICFIFFIQQDSDITLQKVFDAVKRFQWQMWRQLYTNSSYLDSFRNLINILWFYYCLKKIKISLFMEVSTVVWLHYVTSCTHICWIR